MKYLIGFWVNTFFLLLLAIVIACIIGVNTKCDHPETASYFHFSRESNTGNTPLSYIKTYCKECDRHVKTINFRGTPADDSYLSTLKTCIKTTEIIGGQYYTVTATVAIADYAFYETYLRCELQDSDTVVYFSVEFKEEFEAAVSELDEGDTVTFYGEFYKRGCGFKNCELISQ